MLVITNRLPLNTLYPKPEEKCGLLRGNRDSDPPQLPEISKLLYRVSFKFKSLQTGDVYQDLVSSNFLFDTTNTKGLIKSGSLVIYKPKNKTDPNYGMIAQVKKLTAPVMGVDAVRLGGPRNTDPEKMFFDIEFLAPKEVGGQIISIKKNLRKGDMELYHEGNLVYSYECGPDFINYDMSPSEIQGIENIPWGTDRKLEDYYTARADFRTTATPVNRQELSEAEDELWNDIFKLDNNNEPKYPDYDLINQRIYAPDNPDMNLDTYLNDMVERMVKTGFTPNKGKYQKKILGQGKKLKARFPVPRGAKRGQKITVNIGGEDIVVKIPDSETQDNDWAKVLKPNEMVESPIDINDNQGNYNKLNKNLKNKGKLQFIPIVIKAEYAKGKLDHKKEIDEMVKPPKNQQFVINDVHIKKTDGRNWKFKKLDKFDKEVEQLVIDLEVEVDLELGVETKLKEGEKQGVLSGLVDKFENSMVSGSSCPNKMNMLNDAFVVLNKITTPTLSDVEVREMSMENVLNNRLARQNRLRTYQENLNSGRREVRRPPAPAAPAAPVAAAAAVAAGPATALPAALAVAGGAKRRKTKTKRKNYKKKRRTLRLNYIKNDYRKSRKRNRKKRTKRRR